MITIKLLNRNKQEFEKYFLTRKEAKTFINKVRHGYKLTILSITADEVEELYNL